RRTARGQVSPVVAETRRAVPGGRRPGSRPNPPLLPGVRPLSPELDGGAAALHGGPGDVHRGTPGRCRQGRIGEQVDRERPPQPVVRIDRPELLSLWPFHKPPLSCAVPRRPAPARTGAGGWWGRAPGRCPANRRWPE